MGELSFPKFFMAIFVKKLDLGHHVTEWNLAGLIRNFDDILQLLVPDCSTQVCLATSFCILVTFWCTLQCIFCTVGKYADQEGTQMFWRKSVSERVMVEKAAQKSILSDPRSELHRPPSRTVWIDCS